MADVTIIGTGSMGQAIASVVGKGGNAVELIGSGDADKPVTGDVVVLAVPYGAVADVIARRGAQLAGKVVVDITNPVDFATFDSLTVPADGSATIELAAALPASARPHWGKVFSMGAAEVHRRYPRLVEFADLRQSLDPERKFVNDFLAGLGL